MYQILEKKQAIVEKRYDIVWNIPKETIDCILEYSQSTNKYSPPKLFFRHLKLIRDESHICITDEGDLCCE